VAGFLMVTTFLITQPAEEPLLAQLHQQAPPLPLLDPQPAIPPLPQQLLQLQPQKRQEPPQPEQETQQPQQPQQPQQKDEVTPNRRLLQPKHRVKSQVDSPLELEVFMEHLSTHKMERPTGNQVNMVVTWPYLLDLQREGVSEHEKTVRQSEFVDTVWRNLHHERVWSMHMMYEQDEHVIYLLRTLNALAVARGESDRVTALLSSKLFLTKLPDGRTMQYKDAFEYANQNLEGLLFFIYLFIFFFLLPSPLTSFVSSNTRTRTCVIGLVAYIGNSDIYLGGGWEKLEMASMLAERKIYSLSRHDNCSGSDPGCWREFSLFPFIYMQNENIR